MFRKMIEASIDRVVRSVVTEEAVSRHVTAHVMAECMMPGVRDKIAEAAAAHILPEEVAKCFSVSVLAGYVDPAEIAEHIDPAEIAGHLDTTEIVNEVCENVTPDEIVDCLLQRVG